MATVRYQDLKFRPWVLGMIAQANEICAEYAAQGYSLTIRQLYYQLVARGIIQNEELAYKRLIDQINKARLAGLLDWDYVVDRTRSLKGLSHWDDPSEIIASAASSYRVDLWANQPNYVEIWVEKEALAAVVERVAQRWDVPYFSCRGYGSQSEVRRAGLRLAQQRNEGKDVHIIHLGDHDPSGIDMTRDIIDRLELFSDAHTVGNKTLTVNRIALNMDQIEEHKPPPNPAKLTDSRVGGYIENYGRQSWELDALNPTIIGGLIEETLSPLIDDDQWGDDLARTEQGQSLLLDVSNNWDKLSDFALSEGLEYLGDPMTVDEMDTGEADDPEDLKWLL